MENRAVQLRTSLAFYRGKMKVLETPTVERTLVDAVDRHATVFYTCQINIIDEVAGRFTFPRLELYVL